MNFIPHSKESHFPRPRLREVGFSSFKTTIPIKYAGRWGRDALIQSTLDPTVEVIEPWDLDFAHTADANSAFIIVRNRSRELILLSENTDGETMAPAGIHRAFYWPRYQVLSDPRASTARAIWANRGLHVPPSFAVQTLKRLRTSASGVNLIDLQDDALPAPRHWVNYIMAMACTGMVAMTLEEGLTDLSRVTLGPLAQSNLCSRSSDGFSQGDPQS